MPTNNRRSILVVTCLIFLALGTFTAALGPLLPEFSQSNQVSLAAMGSIFSAIFLGALVAQLVAGPLTDRVGQAPVLIGSALLMASGSLGLTFSHSFPLTLGLTVLAGLGHGAVDLSSNVLIARVFTDRSVSALNLLNLFYGFGAFTGPALAGVFFGWRGSGLPVLWLVSFLLLISTLLILRTRIQGGPASGEGQSGQTGLAPGRKLYFSPVLWMLGALLLFYVGSENGISGWITTYMQQTTTMAYENATLIASAFWVALTVGRLVGALVGMRLSARQVMTASLAGSLAGGFILVAGAGLGAPGAITIAGVLVTGFCFGSIFPTAISITTAAFPANPGAAVGLVVAAGSAGGMILPSLLGLLLENVSPLALMAAIAALIALQFGTFWLIRRHN